MLLLRKIIILQRGYTTSNLLHDPSYILLASNMLSEVQIYCTHGSIDSIRFNGISSSGIKTGNSTTEGSGKEMIGVDDVGYNCWLSNTKLVSYMCCNTAGTDGNVSNNSLAYQTVSSGGANAAVGFKKIISYE